MEKFITVIEKASGNYSAYLPDVPGCVSTGLTIDETLQNIKQALEFHLETIIEDGESIPAPISLEEHLANGDIALDDEVVIAYVNASLSKELML